MCRRSKRKSLITITRVAHMASRKAFIAALLVSVFITVGSYFMNNQPIFTGENAVAFALIEGVKSLVGISEQADSNVVYLNVSCDKEVVPFRGNLAEPVGKRDVVDRTMLLHLLSTLDSMHRVDEHTYKYVLMDIRFEEGYDSPVDSLLFPLIGSMEHIVVANHRNITLSDDANLAPKAGMNDYLATVFNTSLVRYEYLQDGEKHSMPLMAYEGTTNHTIDSHFGIYFDEGKLCQNSIFLQFPVRRREAERITGYDEEYGSYLLGNEILNKVPERPSGWLADTLRVLCHDKIVVVGDMDDDVHDTYTGEVPGAVITYKAYEALTQGKHLVNWWLVLVNTLVYFVIAFFLFRRGEFMHRFLPFLVKSPSKLVRFAGSLIRYGTMLLLYSVILSLLFNVQCSFLFATLCFWIIDILLNYKWFNK